MTIDSTRLANLIIAGTEKAGTTSVFLYLADHPQVCSSSSKETDFFRRELSGDLEQDRDAYSRYFCHCRATVPVIMEASPGYLGESAAVVPRIASLLGDVRLLFILRDPIERLYSSYNFHLGRLDIPEGVHFQSYVDKCLAYDRGGVKASELGLGEWYLKALRFGRYADYLLPYFNAFPRRNIKVMFFEELRDDVTGFMRNLSAFLDIDADFWDRYHFHKANVTFSGRVKVLHRAAIAINAKAEPFLRRRPKLKRLLVGCYKGINQAREGYEPLPGIVRQELDNYYRASNQALQDMLDVQVPSTWNVPVRAAESLG